MDDTNGGDGAESTCPHKNLEWAGLGLLISISYLQIAENISMYASKQFRSKILHLEVTHKTYLAFLFYFISFLFYSIFFHLLLTSQLRNTEFLKTKELYRHIQSRVSENASVGEVRLEPKTPWHVKRAKQLKATNQA